MSDVDEAVTVTEGDGAQVDELDSLLSDFDKEAGTEQPKDSPKLTSSDLREVVDFVKEDREERAMERTNADIDSATKTVFGELEGTNLPERAVRGLLLDKAETDRRFAQAFLQRTQNPVQWSKILKATAKEFQQEFTDVDKEATDDREAVAAAVRNASTKAPEADEQIDFAAMSDQELRQWKRAHGGQ